MDERVEEIKPISRIRPMQKPVIAKDHEGRRELMYQLRRSKKARKKINNNPPAEEISHVPKEKESDLDSKSINDIKKRIAYDRAMIMGENNKI